MKLSIFQLLYTLLILSLLSCKTSQSVNSQSDEVNSNEVDQIHSKMVDGNTVFYIGEEIIINQKGDEAAERNYDALSIDDNDRKITKRNWRALFKDRSSSKWKGKTSVMICVDRGGKVTYAEILPKETKTTDPANLKQALIAAMGYEVQADPNAPLQECQKLVFNLDINGKKD